MSNSINATLWVLVTKGEAIFHTAKNNNHDVAPTILEKHSGTGIHDRFNAFETLKAITKNDQQYCWNHVISDAKELEESPGDEVC